MERGQTSWDRTGYHRVRWKESQIVASSLKRQSCTGPEDHLLAAGRTSRDDLGFVRWDLSWRWTSRNGFGQRRIVQDYQDQYGVVVLMAGP